MFGCGVSLFPAWLRLGGTPTSTLVDSLLTYWNLDEASGVRYDSAGTADLTDNNTVGSVAGVHNNGANFVAVNQEYLSVADDDIFTFAGSFTIAAWIYPTTTDVVFFVAKELNDPSSEWSLLTGAAGTLEGRFWGTGGLTQALASVSWTGLLNAWHLGVLVYDATAHTLTVYLDNVAGTPVGTSGTLTNRTGAVTVGGGARGSFQDCAVDEVGIWTRALTTDELTELWNAGAGKFYNGSNFL